MRNIFSFSILMEPIHCTLGFFIGSDPVDTTPGTPQQVPTMDLATDLKIGKWLIKNCSLVDFRRR